MEPATPCRSSTRAAWEADNHVQAHQGAAGVEGQARAAVDRARTHNRSARWTRVAAGRDCPPPVRRVAIPQGEGRTRPLGTPTGAERIAQTVGKRDWEPAGETVVHPESSGDRPGQSAREAVGQARALRARRLGARATAKALLPPSTTRC